MIGLPLAAQAADAPPPVPGMTGDTIDAQAQIEALQDLPPKSWAYQSILDLIDDGIIVGYPDGTFKGNRPLTRYEAAVMTERAVEYVTKKLAVPATAPQVTPKDIDAVRALLDEFRGDIEALKIRVADIDTRLKDVEAKQKDDEATTARAKLGAVYFIRSGSVSEQTAAFTNAATGSCTGAYASAGCALPAGTSLSGGSLGSGVNIGANKYLAGQNQNGYGYQLLRVLLDGDLDPRTSYHIRLENRYFWDTPTAQLSSATTPGGTVNSVPNYLAVSYPTNTTVRFNYGYMQYKDPSGLVAAAGRINETNGTLGGLWADQFNGAEVGYAKYGLNARAGYAFQWPSYNAGGQTTCTFPTPSSSCGYATQTMFADVNVTPFKQLLVGASYVDDINDRISTWNPTLCSVTGKAPAAGGLCPATTATGAPLVTGATGTFSNVVTNLAEGAIYGRYADKVANIPFSLEAEGDYRFGNDPITLKTWTQPWSFWVQGKIGAYTATPFRSYVDAGYIGAGYNSVDPHTAMINGTSYDGQFQGNPNGYQMVYAGLHYWFSKYGRVGVVYQGSDILPGTALPVVSSFGGSYLTHDITNAVWVQAWLQF